MIESYLYWGRRSHRPVPPVVFLLRALPLGLSPGPPTKVRVSPSGPRCLLGPDPLLSK